GLASPAVPPLPRGGTAADARKDTETVVGFLIRRTGQAIFVLFLVTLATLLLIHLFPGGPVRALLGDRATPFQIAYYNKQFGFDQPIYVQYIKWVNQLIHGNLGFSSHLNQSVTSLIAQDLPKTIILVLLGTIVSLLFGIPLGVYQAVHRNSAADYVLTAISFLGYSTPTFFLGIVLVDWFSVDVHIFPPFAPQGSTVGAILGDPKALVLPVFTYAFLLYALWSRYMRSSVLDNLVQDYVRTARAKGASERRVVWGHVFRNSLVSIITLLGLSIPGLVGGAILIEVVFNYPGMGLAFYSAALNVDYEVLLGFTVLATVATVVGNLLADIGYAVLDPRVRY
ncbi:MAG: transporter permease, partial [Actinomycetia bacterium]|nr:transporter permease [Actinomycetes bacterium]